MSTESGADRFDPGAPTLAAAGSRLASALMARPVDVARHTVALAGELARIGLGSSALSPDPGDDRFAAPAWSADPLLRRAVQTHLATTGAATAMLDDAGLDPADDALLRTVVESVADVVAPSNNPVLRALAARRFTAAPREPGDVEVPLPTPPAPATRRLAFGDDVAASPGAVVLRTDAFELVHYLPQTREVHELPVLVVPAPGLPGYLADLSPGRSLVEHLVHGGTQVLLVSWHPAAAGADARGQALLDALDAVERISRAGSTVLLGIGDGAVLTAAVLAHLAAVGLQERVAGAVLVGLDPRDAGPGTAVPRDLRQWLADAAGAAPAAAVELPGELLGTPLDSAVVDRDTLVVASSDAGAWAGLAGKGAVEVVDAPAEAFVAPPASWWATLAEWLDTRTGERCEAPAELGGRGMHALAPSPGEYVSAR
ncbi:hypothetical protein PSU4_36510 [Pseudonocardia sulfidoxydans NBRC 16205]|uniref:Poly-beta-hydroxybutyrate polymerase N-terminal domain-containing protein n=1 Tax=Pseudonocardia sulfidoxydans NBRC 16205 TaxID=1223511 RepID=A0A511DJU3_9PSEU|nr:hypothetical protein [Pseudonocardia sulfidoxydans]GEL24697.1 hypothetical protein PSU4_36510 [Pseudonocardia sulfidoxydans NBRC 16205]